MSAILDAGWDTGVFLLDNIARIDAQGVHILDRRVYPFDKTWVTCPDVPSVATAIIDMVTQSGGTATAAAYGMVLAADHAGRHAQPRDELQRLARILRETRPTNDSVKTVVENSLEICARWEPEQWPGALVESVSTREKQRLALTWQIAEHGATLLPDGVRLLTHCWAETGLTQMVLAATRAGRTVQVFCDETRPYLQGSRLTADALRDAGAAVTVVPDVAAGYLLSEGAVDLVVTGSDRVAADGSVVNKAGTLALALTSKRYGVPFYSLCPRVDRDTPTAAGVPIELRDGEEALHCLGRRTATENVAGFYPAFDRTPADLVTGLITPTGVKAPHEL
ncbi:s-methyl-5-thioribose-1-phosphate isomerase [Amycolatopsis pithecellobii]|uniref:S-methyl-5-thioribose-1-phosphate isomerase n=1 Tax=Amycolatopsis pithecellobii TaxID=664692 RepID=A0A6N7YJE1_9PSEU|nr:s-methyl-5-thioribose-1-phosphate isomerase [Amycolatopsis pithecellobii]MTD53025.1 S-methyl-5-thioribose-1-phosphate isomerase [Amycolatopsis pithecellobii]